ncbi:MAG: hypothetical protein ACI81V_000076 [Lentimonas sp.]|jgi:hypothetical protein
MQHSLNSPWDDLHCAEKQLYHWQTGPLNLWIKRDSSDWLIAETKLPEDNSSARVGPAKDEPTGLEWMRWNFSKPIKDLRISPVMPDRPVVIKARIPSNLAPGAEVTFYVSIPVWVRLATKEGIDESEIIRIGSTIISNTWFGDNIEGELCYAIKTHAVRNIADIKAYPHRAICPITIRNNANTALPIQKICLRAKYLNVYQNKTHLWTSKVKVLFRGNDQVSEVKYSQSAPAEAAECTLRHKAELSPEKNFLKTFTHGFFDF